MGFHHVLAQLLRPPELGRAVEALIGLVPAPAAPVLVVHVADVSDDVVAVQEFLQANRALVVALAGVRLHVTAELCLCVESEAADLQAFGFRIN